MNSELLNILREKGINLKWFTMKKTSLWLAWRGCQQLLRLWNTFRLCPVVNEVCVTLQERALTLELGNTWPEWELRQRAQIRTRWNSGTSTRGQIAKCLTTLRWACVERAWPWIRTSTAATNDGVNIRRSRCNGWFASTSNLGRRYS